MAEEVKDVATPPEPAAPAAPAPAATATPEPAPVPAAVPAAPAATTVTPGAKDAKPDSTPTPAKPVEPSWPADWREKAAGGDAKKLARLSTYASPQAVADALIAAQNRISAGDLKPTLPKDAKPEELAAWRAANGIPESPEKYDLKGIPVNEDGKPIVDKFLKSAHEANMTPSQVEASLKTYYSIVDEMRNDRLARDEEVRQKTEDTLRAEWGLDFRRNLNLVQNLLDGAPQGMREKFLLGRLSDGTPIGSSPEALKFLVGLALEKNPQGVVVPSGVQTQSGALEEYQSLQKFMREHRREYNNSAEKQERMQKLIGFLGQNGMIDGQGNVVGDKAAKAA